MANFIQAQGMINGKKTFFITRPKDVKYDDGTTLADKDFGGNVDGIDRDELEELLYAKLNGITFDEESYIMNSDDIPDDALDPEMIAYIDKLFAGLNDLYIDVPETNWTLNTETNLYELNISVEELSGNEYPILHIIPNSNTNPDYDVEYLNTHIKDVVVGEKLLTIIAEEQLQTGFRILLKGINVSGGRIIEDYNKVVESVNKLYNSIVSDDIIVDVPINGWTENTDNTYQINISVIGMNEDQNPVYGIYSNEEITDTERESFDKIEELITNNDSITLIANAPITTAFKIILKSVMISQGGEYGSYVDLVNAVTELRDIVNDSYAITLTDNYFNNEGKAVDRIAVSSFALYTVYNLLKQRMTNIEYINILKYNNGQKGNLQVQKKNGWCRVVGQIIPTNTSIDMTQLTSGLPAPLYTPVQQYLMCYNGESPLFISISTEGILSMRYGKANSIYYLDISYPYNE